MSQPDKWSKLCVSDDARMYLYNFLDRFPFSQHWLFSWSNDIHEGGCFGDQIIIRDVDCFCDQMIIRDMHQELVISQNIGGQLQVNQNTLQWLGKGQRSSHWNRSRGLLAIGWIRQGGHRKRFQFQWTTLNWIGLSSIYGVATALRIVYCQTPFLLRNKDALMLWTFDALNFFFWCFELFLLLPWCLRGTFPLRSTRTGRVRWGTRAFTSSRGTRSVTFVIFVNLCQSL